jgi:hypothetical protein
MNQQSDSLQPNLSAPQPADVSLREGKMIQFLIVVFLTVGCANVSAQTDLEQLMAQSKPEIQAQIQRVYTTLNPPKPETQGQDKPAALSGQEILAQGRQFMEDISRADPNSLPPLPDPINSDPKPRPRSSPRIPAKVFQEVQVLKAITNDQDEIVKQLAIFAATPSGDEGHPLFVLMILHLLDFPPSTVIPILAPYLNVENRDLRSIVRDWFQGHDNAGSSTLALQPINYDDYRCYVSRLMIPKQEVPVAFIEYIYERHAGKALLVFAYASGTRDVVARMQVIRKMIDARHQGKELEPHDETGRQLEERRHSRLSERREIELAEHLVSNAIWLKEHGFDDRFQKALPEAAAELAKLAKHDQWWARLYVVYIMRQHPELRQSDVLQELRADSNSLVSDLAKSMRD